jgi:hypothetical protein
MIEAVLVVQQILNLLIKNLPGEVTGLLQNCTPKLRIGVISEILPLIDKTQTIGIEHDTKEITDFSIMLSCLKRERLITNNRAYPDQLAPHDIRPFFRTTRHRYSLPLSGQRPCCAGSP